MIFFDDILANKELIEEAIKQYGYAPEHNFYWYRAQSDNDSTNVFVYFDDGSALLTIEERRKGVIYVFSSPIASLKRRCEIIVEYLNKIFENSKIKKIVFELETSLYKELILNLPDKFKARKINYTLSWPIYDIENFDDALSGRKYKTLRKEKNNFYKNHSVEIVNAKEYKDKDLLLKIIEDWRKKRGGNDRAHFYPYENFVKNNFQGTDEARVLIVDGKPVGINAGWLIPNTKRFYGALGIHNYSVEDLGDMLYLEDLLYLKSMGYKEADMGGGEEALTNFKNKFGVKSLYRTHIFSIVKNAKIK